MELAYDRANNASVFFISAPGFSRQTKVGYPGSHVSGNTINPHPCVAASAINATARANDYSLFM